MVGRASRHVHLHERRPPRELLGRPGRLEPIRQRAHPGARFPLIHGGCPPMKPIRFASLMVFAALSCAALVANAAEPNATAGAAFGKPAPLRTVRMKSANGTELSIAEAAGKKGTLVLFIC